MACGACARKRKNRTVIKKRDYMRGYESMQPTQVKARLDTFKRKYCSTCNERYDCTLNTYLKCKKKDN